MSVNSDVAEVAKFDSLASRWWDPDGPLRTLHELNPHRVAYLSDRAELNDARILDVGCGGGILTEALAAAGARTVGTDLAESSIAIAQAHARENGFNIEYRSDPVAEIAASEPGSFDAVICFEVLEHVDDPDAIVAACASAVKPGGDVFLSTISRSPKSFLLAIVAAEYVLKLVPRGTHEYLNFIRPAELAAMCRAARLDLRDLTGLHFNPISREYTMGGNVDVNFFLHARRPPD